MSGRSDAALDSTIAIVAAELGLVRPEVVALEGGAANRSFRLLDARHDFVLRLQGGTSPALGASGASELAVQSLAAAAGLAPAIVYSDPSQGILVMQHVAGRVPALSEFRRSGMLRRAGDWIARLHALAPPPGLAAIDFGERAAAYLALLDSRSPGPFATGLGERLAGRRVALPPCARLVSCHHDLHHRNFVDTGDAFLAVDWEYAGPGDPAADLAACIGYHDLDAAGVDSLLAGYGQDSPALRARIAALGWIFNCLWFGWNACAAAAGLPIDAKLQAKLAARLAG